MCVRSGTVLGPQQCANPRGPNGGVGNPSFGGVGVFITGNANFSGASHAANAGIGGGIDVVERVQHAAPQAKHLCHWAAMVAQHCKGAHYGVQSSGTSSQ